ncbi:MAG: hypothetical protein A2X46_00820 [Lentisphaerae bacterium GWF2_57_35]|nr:MAG: hypothetical protein A2X46_00820 [Lentisphaerae bacterium GWF2_57_35]
MLIGIGNALHGDDGVGPLVAQEFSSPDWLCLDAGTAPENFTSVVRREQPDQVVLVDAAELGARPGEFRRVPKEKVRDVGLGTHMLPLSHLMTYLEEITPHIVFVGLQPRSLEDDAALSPEVRAGAARLMDLLQHNELEKIPIL